MWNPVPNTWVKVIKVGFFATWPGLTEQIVSKHCKRILETEEGHMKADRQGVRSTKCNNKAKTIDEAPSKARVNEFYLKTTDLTNKLYSDQIGRFPVTLNRGNKYVIIAY